jgi:hypothetical protein
MDNNTFTDYIMQKLDELHNAKVGKIHPDYVTLNELSSVVIDELRSELNNLFCQGKIKVGDTLNGKYIVSHKWGNSNKQQHTSQPTTSEH